MRPARRPCPLRAVTSGVAVFGAVAAAALGLSGCSAGGDEVVFAAPASFTDVAPQLIDAYESAHPGTEITLTLASSARLIQQVNAGHQADVLVTADVAALDALDPGSNLARVGTVAENGLTLVAAPEVSLPEDDDAVAAWLPGVTVALCAPEVPCGRAAHAWLRSQDATAVVAGASLESNVRQVLTKVAEGQADAGFVYATDAAAAPQLDAVALAGPPNEYPVLVAENGRGDAFGRWLGSVPAQRIIADAGFGLPEAGDGTP